MRKSTSLAALAFLLCLFFLLSFQTIQAQVSGVKTIPGDYSSITAAISQIRIVGVSGPTFLELQPGYNSSVETYPINIRSIPGNSTVNSLTISPSAAATGLSIISASSGPVINLIGASNIIIDGRPGRTGIARQLTIRNNAAEGNAVSFVDGAVQNKVTWCILEGRHVPNVGGVVFFGRSGEPIPVGIFLENSANELSNNMIRTINLASVTIYSAGGDPVYNSGNKIINNEITGFRRYGIYMSGFNSGWMITGNSFYNPDPLFTSNDMSVIQFGGAPAGAAINNTISGNFIGGQAPQAGPSKWNADYIWGISLWAGSFTVENNTIQNFNMVQGSVDVAIFIGISVTNDASATISGNLIGGSPATNGDIVMTGDKINCTGIANGSCSFVSITNNKIGNFTLLANISSQFRGIASVGAYNTVITGNEIDFVNNTSTGLISFKAILLRPNANCPVIPGPAEVDHNLINNITLSSSDDNDVSFTGIEIGGTSTQSLQLHHNEVYKINVSSPNAAVSFAGISINDRVSGNTGNIIGSGTEANSIMITGKTVTASAILVNESPDASISDDIIGSITVNGTLSATLKGINIQGGGKANVTGNQLKDISVSSAGSSDMVGIIFNGVVTGSETSTLHNNHVHKINVSSSDGEASFAGIKVNDRLASNNGNIIGSPAEANSIMVTGKATNVTAILVSESANVSISDDIIGNITVNGTLAAALKGIHIQGGSRANVTGNEIKDLSVTSSGPSDMTGIIFNGAVTGSNISTLHNNHVHKINVSSSDGAASFAGIRINDRISGNNGNVIGSPTEANSIMVTGKSASANGIRLNNSANVSISDDIIANITANGTLNPGSVNGILFEGGLLAQIDSNDIHHLTAPVTRGIFIQPLNGSSAVTLDKNNLTGLNTTTGKGIETVVVSGASLNLAATDNTVTNWQTGVLLAAANGGTLQLSFQNNSVVANQTGFINNNSTPVNATCNWWGNASGPSGAGPGTGNPVGSNVIFSPWATLATYVAVNAGPDQTITGSGSRTLTPTYTFCGTATYLWSTGATTPSITVSPTVNTVYTIKITDANGHEATDEVTVFFQAVSLPQINILPTAVIEGNSGTNNAIFILFLNKLSAVPVTVQYQTANNSATAPQDYIQKSGTIIFPANSLIGLIQTITIPVKGDVVPETDEIFKVLLSNAVNGTINTANANCIIIDNDPPCLRISDTSATENSQLAVVRVSLSTASSNTVKVKYDTKDGTAKSPADYIKVSNGTLTFQPGETTKYITIVIKPDALYNEPTEKFEIILKDPENANIVTTSSCTADKDATVSILNSASQQNREMTKTQITGGEETLDISVPGILPRYSQLTIQGLKGLDNELVIFDSKGVVVAKLQQYKHTWSPGNMTAGIYFYQLRVRNKEGKYEIYRGKILIID